MGSMSVATKKDEHGTTHGPSGQTKHRRLVQKSNRQVTVELLVHTIAQATEVAQEHFPQGLVLRPPEVDADTARNQHDLFNLVVLPVVIAADLLYLATNSESLFWLFVGISYVYFLTDLIWVVLVPQSVKSPIVIKGHHTLTLVYMLLPCCYTQFGWGMASCLIVEINTWFLIARRYWRRATIWFSVGFYTSWISIRVIIYPYLVYAFLMEYLCMVFDQLDQDNTGTISRVELMKLSNWFHIIGLAPTLQIVLTVLNFKWTYDLVLSKLRQKGNQELKKGL